MTNANYRPCRKGGHRHNQWKNAMARRRKCKKGWRNCAVCGARFYSTHHNVFCSKFYIKEDADKELRKLQRALWLARAERAGHCVSVFFFVTDEYLNTPLNIYGYAAKKIGMNRMLKPRRWMKIWQKVELLCRTYADKFKEAK